MEYIEELIDKFDILSEAFFDFVMNAEDEVLHELIEGFNNSVNLSPYSKDGKKGFSFVANTTLSGSSFPCSSLECRFRTVHGLARNAILYADTVYIQNPFENYNSYKSFDINSRNNIHNDFIIIHSLMPLFRAGVFDFVKSKVHHCNNCYKGFQKQYLDVVEYNSQSIEELLADYIIENVDFYLFLSNGKKCVEISGKSDLLEHPIVISFVHYVPNPLDKIRIARGKVKLDARQIRESGLIYNILEPLSNNLYLQNYYSKYYSANVLTDREFDIRMLSLLDDKFHNSGDNQRRSKILKTIDHLVPFVNDVSMDKLIQLRKNEGEAFEVYRDKISKLTKGVVLSDVEANDLYYDEIRPELNRINMTLKQNKDYLWGNIKSNVILASTYVSASLFTGILPANIDTIVASIGGFGFAKSISDDIVKLAKKPAAKENELYFLWKLQNENKIRI